ncbi:glycine-rich domain-containing protein [Pseudomonas chlororaphis]
MDYPKSVPSAGLVNGRFVDENPLTGTPGSLIPADWGNGVTQELLAVITAADLTPSEANLTQLLSAIRSISRKSAGLGIQRFTANGSFTVPEGVTKIWLSGCAGGGGGGACPGGTSATASGGGGGGAGQPVIRFPVSVTPGQVIPVVIGAAGVGASGAVLATGGGNTLVGSAGAILSLSGGSGGGSGVNLSGYVPGAKGGAGFPEGGDATDVSSNTVAGVGGAGASGPFGAGGGIPRSGTTSGGPGKPAYGYGAGGSGAGGYYIAGTGLAQPGGNGVPGFMLIEW